MEKSLVVVFLDFVPLSVQSVISTDDVLYCIL